MTSEVLWWFVVCKSESAEESCSCQDFDRIDHDDHGGDEDDAMDIFHRWQWAGLVRCGVTRADHPSWSSSIIYTVIVMVIVIVNIMVIIIFGMIITILVASISLWPSSSRSSSTWSSSTSTTTSSSSSSSQVLFLLMRILSYTTTTATPHPLGSFHSALQCRRNIGNSATVVLLNPRSLSLHCALE